MSTITTTKLDRLNPLNDKLALAYVNQGLDEKQILSTLKQSNYKVSIKSTVYSVDAITICNIARGIRQTVELVQNNSYKITKAKGLHKTK